VNEVVIAIATTPDNVRLLDRTLKSVREVCGVGVPIYVIENGLRSCEDTSVRRICDELGVEYRHCKEKGKSRALNILIRELGLGLVVFLDDDVRLESDVVLHYSRAAAIFGRGCFFGGPISADYEEVPVSHVESLLPISARGWDLGLEADGVAIDRPRFLGCNWAAWAEDVVRLGGFNELCGPGAATGATGQETDMQTRMLRSGLRGRYVAKARVAHFVPASRSNSAWIINRAERNGKGLKQSLKCRIGYWELRALMSVMARFLAAEFACLVFGGDGARLRRSVARSYVKGLIQLGNSDSGR